MWLKNALISRDSGILGAYQLILELTGEVPAHLLRRLSQQTVVAEVMAGSLLELLTLHECQMFTKAQL